MEYSVKEIAKNVEISEQGLYKRIKANYKKYIEQEFIILKQVDKLGGTTTEQIFITEKGLNDLLTTKKVRQGATLISLDNRVNQVDKPLNVTTKPVNKPNTTNDIQTVPNTVLNLLNQTIEDLKEENKRLNEKLDKQEERFDEKLEKQKQEFKEQYDRQQEAYQKTLDRIMQSFNTALLELPKPREEVKEINETPQQTSEIIQQEQITKEEGSGIDTETKGLKKLFKRLFLKGESEKV